LPSRRRDSARRRLALGVLTLLAACGGEAPRLEVTTLAVEPAADRHAGVPLLDATYQLRNVGGRSLLLDGVVPPCGCTTVSGLPSALAPDTVTTLALSCRPPRASGRVVRDLHLRSSDPASPDLTVPLTLAGVAAAADPAALYLGYVPVGGSATRDVVLASAVAPESLPPPPAGFALEAMPPRADAAAVLRIRFAPIVPGVVRASLDLGPGGTIAAAGVGYGDVVAFPAELVLPASTGATALAGVTVMGLGVDALQITRVEYPPGLAGELRTVVPGRQFRLVVRSRDVSGGGADDGSVAAIRIRTDSSAEPVVTIPIVGASAGRAAAPRS
jgi:hypothetical protein